MFYAVLLQVFSEGALGMRGFLAEGSVDLEPAGGPCLCPEAGDVGFVGECNYDGDVPVGTDGTEVSLQSRRDLFCAGICTQSNHDRNQDRKVV